MYICCICREYTYMYVSESGFVPWVLPISEAVAMREGHECKNGLNSLESGELYADYSEDHASDREDPTKSQYPPWN